MFNRLIKLLSLSAALIMASGCEQHSPVNTPNAVMTGDNTVATTDATGKTPNTTDTNIKTNVVPAQPTQDAA